MTNEDDNRTSAIKAKTCQNCSNHIIVGQTTTGFGSQSPVAGCSAGRFTIVGQKNCGKWGKANDA